MGNLYKLNGKPLTEQRLIKLQLGSGCSMAAIVDAKPINTSMGFTPNEDLLMSTRIGDIDAGFIKAKLTKKVIHE